MGAEVLAFLQVVLIDISLSGDNAIIIAMAAAGLPESQRKKAIALGIGAAICLRIVFALITTHLLDVPYIMPVGGAFLLWFCWKMFQEIRSTEEDKEQHVDHAPKKLHEAVLQITLADVSMSLDNIMAVAGAAHGHPVVMIIGLVLAIAFMAVAANFVIKLLKRFPWLNWLGLLIILYVALRMIIGGLL